MVDKSTECRLLLGGVPPVRTSSELEGEHVAHGVFWCAGVLVLSVLLIEQIGGLNASPSAW